MLYMLKCQALRRVLVDIQDIYLKTRSEKYCIADSDEKKSIQTFP